MLIILQIDLPPYMRQHEVNIQWCTVLLQTVSKPAPPSALEGDNFTRELNHWWKAKKWAYFVLNRLFVRYVARYCATM